jgi:membrane associated rhomboid family serine protease
MKAGAFYRLMAHLGFGLVTYLPPVFFTVDISTRGDTGIKAALAIAFSWFGYTLLLGTFGWVFAIPAIIIAGVGLAHFRSLKLNIVTIAIAIIILIWNLLTLAVIGK